MWRWIAGVLGILLLGGILTKQLTKPDSSKGYRYIITETSRPTSLDPLDADNTNNLPVARMVYATPLEASEDNQLKSQVLSAFSYDPSTRTIEWTARADALFDDGSSITSDDIAFAVARMAHARPKFPVIESIQGLHEWIGGKEPLKTYPSGIVVERDKVKITFAQDISHPMFRFCLEIFSIIPKKCVDLQTGKISCEKVPSSGYYSISQRDDKEIHFTRRNDLKKPVSASLPGEIVFEYSTPPQVFDRLQALKNENAIAAGNELQYSLEAMDSLKSKMKLRHLPASRFAVLQLHPKTKAFQNKKCRAYFADAFRKANLEIARQPIEASLFTKVLPGYESEINLRARFPLTAADIKECERIFAAAKIPWGYSEAEKESLFFKVLKRTFETLHVPLSEPIVKKTRSDLSEAYATGEIAILNTGSGFWALDPAGDLKMLFTPNLHRGLSPVSEDGDLQRLLKNVDGSRAAFQAVNEYIYDDAKFNVYSHPRRFYVTPNEHALSELPFALTSPAPWQVFRVK